MSTFSGLIEEIPDISVDRFDGKNLRSSIYFLSHCHTDHMHGLKNEFFKDLHECNKYLYCSEISKIFLQARYSYTGTCVKHIDIDKKVLLEYKNKDNVDVLYVTCISAGHCPGSVMFLFEKSDKLILYTGDFRIDPRTYKDITPLHFRRDFNDFPKKLAQIYLDTTFLDFNYTFLPTRKESMREIYRVTTEWLKKNDKNIVVLECPALYGYESLYIDLSKNLNERIHVKDSVYENYCSIPHLARHITNNPLTRIHACTNKNKIDRSDSGLKCHSVPKKNVLTIVPSVLQWKKKDTSILGEWNKARKNTYNVCFSTHASFEELQKFILYFKPKKIYPCVCPQGFERKIYSLLDEIQSNIEKKKNVAQNYEKYTLQILKKMEIINKQWTKYYFCKGEKNYF